MAMQYRKKEMETEQEEEIHSKKNKMILLWKYSLLNWEREIFLNT